VIPTHFTDRQEAGRLLADHLRPSNLPNPLVLGIPRGGVEVGAALADSLGAELDVVLSRKLRAPDQPELAIGAVSESGEVLITDPELAKRAGPGYLAAERAQQLDEIKRRSRLFRAARPPADMTGRPVIVTDDGIATGSTMIAALRTVRARAPSELIVAVPVAPAQQLARIRDLCDRTVCLYTPERFWAIGQFYSDFEQVPDERVAELLRRHAASTHTAPPAAS